MLKDNGIDPAKFKEQIDKQRAARGEQVGGQAPQASQLGQAAQAGQAQPFQSVGRGVPQFAGGAGDSDGDHDGSNGKVNVYG